MKGEDFMSVEELIELRDKTKMEAYLLKERKILHKPKFIFEKELFIKNVLELILSGNIVELQNIIKEDFWDCRRMLQDNKWTILYNLINNEYIEKTTVISTYTIDEISDIREFYNILETIPIITEKGKEELKRLKKIYGE